MDNGAFRYLDISFTARGKITQSIRILKSCKLTDEDIVDKLNCGLIQTSVQEKGGELAYRDPDNGLPYVKLGTVVDVDNDLEYENFELE